MDAALQARFCEAIDFITPFDDGYYLGVDVEPGHLAAGPVAEWPKACEEVPRALEGRGGAIVTGPSGAGKSALVWKVARSSRHVVRRCRVRSLNEAHVTMLTRRAWALRANPAAPVGFVFDNVGAVLRTTWDALAARTSCGRPKSCVSRIRTPPANLTPMIAQAVPPVPAIRLHDLVADADLPGPLLDVMIEALAQRLEVEPNPGTAAAAFRGLSERHTRNALEVGLPTVEAPSVPRVQIGTSVTFGIPGVYLSFLEPLPRIDAAARVLRAAKSCNPRRASPMRLSPTMLDRLACARPVASEDLLASLVGTDA